jgi:uncharacterized cupredoxin-like copper-binding protein
MGAVAALAAGVFVIGCGDDGGKTEATAGTTAPATTEAPATTTHAGHAAATVKVQLADYSFSGLPKSVKAGTKLTVVNNSTVELHEFVAFRLPDSEKRSAKELAALPMEELMPLFSSAPPATVLLAPPNGAPPIAAVGDGTLTEPGRYVIFCAIPTGADPKAYLDAAATSDGPPQVPGGPPHFMNGMYADLVVE